LLASLFLIGCGSSGGGGGSTACNPSINACGQEEPVKYEANYTISMWGRDITIQDNRTGLPSQYQSLESLGIVGKFEDAVAELGTTVNQEIWGGI
jgi:hypothetical protein